MVVRSLKIRILAIFSAAACASLKHDRTAVGNRGSELIRRAERAVSTATIAYASLRHRIYRGVNLVQANTLGNAAKV